ncbi:MAG: hypothetical protein KKB70_08125 [Proteobacteria bacterium]|nr:hypothetical protein [Pseudomonadota bacterium]
MRAYLIEDIYDNQAEKILAALDEKGFKGPIEGIYYLPLLQDLLEGDQPEHMQECGPYMMALEAIDRVGDTFDFKLELLVRGKGRMRCSCVTYATPSQREYMIDFLDSFIRELDIPV